MRFIRLSEGKRCCFKVSSRAYKFTVNKKLINTWIYKMSLQTSGHKVKKCSADGRLFWALQQSPAEGFVLFLPLSNFLGTCEQQRCWFGLTDGWLFTLHKTLRLIKRPYFKDYKSLVFEEQCIKNQLSSSSKYVHLWY